jgi:hypothetical protein
MHLAPAISHMNFSSLACAKAVVRLGGAASKTHLFLCFHKTQAPRLMTEFSPFLAAPVTIALLLVHHWRKETSSGYGEIPCTPIVPRRESQNCLEKTQDTRMWSMVSSWLHSRHRSGWVMSCQASRSAVQHFLWAASHKKNRHFGGAHVFPDSCERFKVNWSEEEAFICLFGWILSACCKPPKMIVIHPLLKLKVVQNVP